MVTRRLTNTVLECADASGTMHNECNDLQLNADRNHHLESGDRGEQHRVGPQHPAVLERSCCNYQDSSRESVKVPSLSGSGGMSDAVTAAPPSTIPPSDSEGMTHAVTAAPRSIPCLMTEKMNLSSKDWPKIPISSTMEELDDGLMAITGTKSPCWPETRPEELEKDVHFISSGMRLCDSTPERYEARKQAGETKRTGLEAMDNADSEFSISLTIEEIDDDFMAITGTKRPRWPERRPEEVEKNVRFISPGMRLCALRPEHYEVGKRAGKTKRTGSEAMDNTDTESE